MAFILAWGVPITLGLPAVVNINKSGVNYTPRLVEFYVEKQSLFHQEDQIISSLKFSTWYNLWWSLTMLFASILRSSDCRTSTCTEGTLCIKKIWTDAIRVEPKTNSSCGTEQHPPPSTISTPTASTGATVDNTVGTKSVCLTCGICSIIWILSICYLFNLNTPYTTDSKFTGK